MQSNQQQSAVVGAALVVLGVVWWFNMWWLVWPGLLFVAGGMAYTQRRRLGNTAEAVQAFVWLVGLGLLFMLHAVFPGILLLAGASILLRGREGDVDAYIQSVLSSLRNGAPRKQATAPSQNVPITTVTASERTQDDQPTTGDTTRL